MSVAHETRYGENSLQEGKSSHRGVDLGHLIEALSVDKPQAWRHGLDIDGIGIRAHEESS